MSNSQEATIRDPQDSPPQTTFNRWAGGIERFQLRLSYISALGMLLIILPTVADVTGRLIFNSPVRGAYELTGLLMAIVIFMGIAYCQVQKMHVRVSILTEYGSKKFQRVVDLFVYFFSIVMIGIALYATSTQAIYAVRIGEYMFGSTRFPVWPARVLVALGFFFLIVQFIVDLVRAFLQLVEDKRRC